MPDNTNNNVAQNENVELLSVEKLKAENKKLIEDNAALTNRVAKLELQVKDIINNMSNVSDDNIDEDKTDNSKIKDILEKRFK